MSVAQSKQTVTYQLPFAEVRRLMFRHYLFNSKFLFALAFLVGLGVLMLTTGEIFSGVIAMTTAFAAFAGVMASVLRTLRNQPWRTEPKTVTFDAESFTGTGRTVSVSLAWNEFNRFSQDSRYFYLRGRDGSIFWIPRDAFTAAQASLFIHYAQSAHTS